MQVDGKRRDLGLGSFVRGSQPVAVELPLERKTWLTLSEARDKAAIARVLIRAGEDPAQIWRKAKRGGASRPTFEWAAREYVREMQSGWKNEKHQKQWLSSLENHVFKKLGATEIETIDLDELEDIIKPIWLAIPETARRVRQRIIKILHYGHSKGWRAPPPTSEALSLRLAKQPKRAGGFEAMPFKDLPAFMRDLRSETVSVGRLALEFVVLTGTRSGEVRGARWNEIDQAAKRWTIPAERMKMGRQHTVPLSEEARAVLQRAKFFADGEGSLIFPSRRGKRLTDVSLAKAMRKTAPGSHTVHGFRSSLRDWGGEQFVTTAQGERFSRFESETLEFALAHIDGDKVYRAYRRSDAYEKRVDLMDAWAAFLSGAT